MKWINRFYIFFVAIILSITTGFGIAAFYPQPVRPAYPAVYRQPALIPASCSATPTNAASEECIEYYKQQEKDQQEQAKQQEDYGKEVRDFENANAGYTRTAIFFGIAFGALYALLGLVVLKKSKLVATSLLLSAVLTAIFTRLLISLASLGENVVSTNDTNMVGIMEFVVLLILSIVIIIVGFTTLKEE